MNLLSQEIPESFKNLTPTRFGLGVYVNLRKLSASPNKRRGSANALKQSTKPTLDQIQVIKTMREAGASIKAIAKKTKRTEHQVRYFLSGRVKLTAVPVQCIGCKKTFMVTSWHAKEFRFCTKACRYGKKS